ncbi:tyrosine--tRNA ligase [Candidatus Phytoplasma pini]|uniref:Tyrosine--tRNA ligase n=1 Tax=Candidatus Phytoplasma pini TaxID=267362 RepID=A0A559KJ32_9MOLU|nr:tyrosine--tRNA ligase [Candidatus Phytoplasma pini]TVY12119.1 tyrosyl-tRNA synthetase [Candidatus Phytoplasma pini]
MSLFQELKWRDAIKDCNDEKKLEQLLENEKIFFYCGFDPTASSLTIGHLVQIIIILLFQKKGHFPIILIGQATGLIGDPKETKERTLLTSEKNNYNCKKIQEQLKKFLPSEKIKFVNNYDWISQIDLISFFRKYGKLFNVNYMISKEKIAKRLNIGISYTEFSYMILQSLDFHQLYKNHNVQLQIGGSDQWGNITSGLELIRKMEFSNKRKIVCGMSIPLLLDSKGIKFGKSENNALWLDAELTSPYQIYQYFLNIEDSSVIHFLKILTLLEKDKIEELYLLTQKEPRKRKAQQALSQSIVSFLHGEKIFQECLKVKEILFIQKKQNISLKDFVLLSKYLVTVEIKEKINLIDALVLSQLADSKKEAKRLIQLGSIKIFNQTINNMNLELTADDFLYYDKYIILTKKNKIHALLSLNKNQ